MCKTQCRRRAIGVLAFILAGLVRTDPTLAAQDPHAQWRSPILGRESVTVYLKRGPNGRPAELPANVRAKLGGAAVEYAAFVTSRLPAPAAAALREEAFRAGLRVSGATRSLPVELAFHSFDPVAGEGRNGPWPAEGAYASAHRRSLFGSLRVSHPPGLDHRPAGVRSRDDHLFRQFHLFGQRIRTGNDNELQGGKADGLGWAVPHHRPRITADAP